MLIDDFAPVRIETWAIHSAMLIAFLLTSLRASRIGRLQARSMLMRSVIVGGCTLIASFLVGELLI